MKKLVWSETVVDGGKPLAQLPPCRAPPGRSRTCSSCPTSWASARPEGACAAGATSPSSPIRSRARRPCRPSASGRQGLDAGRLNTLDEADIVEIARRRRPAVVITLDYPAPQTIRSATLFFPGAGNRSSRARPSIGAGSQRRRRGWRKVADLPLSLVPASAGFAPVTAAHFRVVVSAGRPPSTRPSCRCRRRPGPFAAMAKPKPLRLSQLVLSAEPRVNQFEAKAGFATADDYYALDAGVDPNEAASRPAPSST
jgi:hypothetical protein